MDDRQPVAKDDWQDKNAAKSPAEEQVSGHTTNPVARKYDIFAGFYPLFGR
jgi:hypothetical protein